jgi:hypothetical protein
MANAAMQDRLRKLLRQVFADGVLTNEEKDQLRTMYRQGGLTVAEVRSVFESFLAEVWGEIWADRVVTAEERAKLETIVRELKLPSEMIPEAVRSALDAPGG